MIGGFNIWNIIPILNQTFHMTFNSFNRIGISLFQCGPARKTTGEIRYSYPIS